VRGPSIDLIIATGLIGSRSDPMVMTPETPAYSFVVAMWSRIAFRSSEPVQMDEPELVVRIISTEKAPTKQRKSAGDRRPA